MTDTPGKTPHATMVTRLTKNPEDIAKTIDSTRASLIHAVMGISGEAGELLDTVKKHVMYDSPLDHDNIVEELGDLEFFMEMLRQAIAVDRDTILLANTEKLTKRYPEQTFTNHHATERLDKLTREPDWKDGEIIAVGMNSKLIAWDAVKEILYDTGQSVAEFDITNLTTREKQRLGIFE